MVGVTSAAAVLILAALVFHLTRTSRSSDEEPPTAVPRPAVENPITVEPGTVRKIPAPPPRPPVPPELPQARRLEIARLHVERACAECERCVLACGVELAPCTIDLREGRVPGRLPRLVPDRPVERV